MIIKFHLLLSSILLLLLAASELANGQLEAVGAVLSVVPVTSILATAGLVGVKLAALSRLLDLLGYDRAYLAQNLNTGTAATPIGLQTRYAYMFPYVPGLNISVKGDDSFGMPKEAINEMTEDGTKVSGPGAGLPKRKTYPAMTLPGDYENQRKPFRGSGALKDIFQQAGIKVHVPTAVQQQQIQQQLNLPQKGNSQQQQHQVTQYEAAQQQQQQHHQLQPLLQDNRLPQPPPPPPPPSPTDLYNNNNNNRNNIHNTDPSNHIMSDKDNHQPVNKPSSSSSQQNEQQSTSSSSSGSSSSNGGNQLPPAGLGRAADPAQVNMPHPDYSRDRHRHNHPPPPSVHLNPLAPSPIKPVHVPDDNDSGRGNTEADRHHQAQPRQPPLSQVHHENHAIIPQRELLSAMIVREAAARRNQMMAAAAATAANNGPPGHQVGPLTQPGLDAPGSLGGATDQGQEGPLRAVPLFPSRPQFSPISTHFSSSVPDSFKPQRHPEMHQYALEALARQRERNEQQAHEFERLRQFRQRQQQQQQPPPPPHPTVASQGPGFSPLPSNSNFYPPEFIPAGPPGGTTTVGDTDDDESHMTPRFRRRKRSAAAAAAPLLPNHTLVDSPRSIEETVASQQRQQQQLEARPQTFGMPAVNINTLRRRRRRRRQAEPSLLESKLLLAAGIAGRASREER